MALNGGVALDGKTARELGMCMLRASQRPILAPTVDNVVTVPYMHGAYDFGAYMGPKSFNLECAFNTRNSVELQRRASDFAAFLLDADGRPRTISMVFDYQPDRHYMIRYSGNLPIDRVVGLGTFSLPVTAYDPFAYSVYSSDEINVDSLISVDSDIYVDTKYSFTVSGPQSIIVYNYGNQNAQPIIEISGAFSSLSLEVGGVVFTYNFSMSGTLTLDFKRKTSIIGTTNVLQNTNAKFGKLPIGKSNIVVGGTGLNFNMTIKFRQKYA